VEAAERAEIAGPVLGLATSGEASDSNHLGPSTIGEAVAGLDDTGSPSQSDIPLESVEASSDLDEVAVTVSDGEGLPIISCTPGFTRLCGASSVGARLKDWIADSKWERFSSWIKIKTDEFAWLTAFDDRLVLSTPCATHAGIEYVVEDCTLQAISETVSDDTLQDGRYALRMRLESIKQRAKRKTGNERHYFPCGLAHKSKNSQKKTVCRL